VVRDAGCNECVGGVGRWILVNSDEFASIVVEMLKRNEATAIILAASIGPPAFGILCGNDAKGLSDTAGCSSGPVQTFKTPRRVSLRDVMCPTDGLIKLQRPEWWISCAVQCEKSW